MSAAAAVHVAFSTAPDEAEAQRIAKALVGERLAACVNILKIAHSVFRWQDEVVHEPEWLLIIKTTAERLPVLQTRLAELHPYDVPELIAWPVTAGLPPYLAWVVAETR